VRSNPLASAWLLGLAFLACSPRADRSEEVPVPPQAPDALLRARLEELHCCRDVEVNVDFAIAVNGTLVPGAAKPGAQEETCAVVARETERIYGNAKTIEVSLDTPEGARACSLTTEQSVPSPAEADEVFVPPSDEPEPREAP
jgi:hypothetical protein